MDELEINIRKAWPRVLEQLKRNADKRLQRRIRVAKHAFAAPLRPWCIVLRASDSRIDETRCCLLSRKDADQNEEHTVLLPSWMAAKVNRPVRIMYPGERLLNVAALLGCSVPQVQRLVRSGALQVRYEPGNAHRQGGPRIPFIWSDQFIDANSDKAQTYDPLWDPMWRFLHWQVPLGDVVELRRVPFHKPYSGLNPTPCFRGWRWLCPRCGRRVEKLYYPVPVYHGVGGLGLGDGLPKPTAAERAAIRRALPRQPRPPLEFWSSDKKPDRTPITDADRPPVEFRRQCLRMPLDDPCQKNFTPFRPRRVKPGPLKLACGVCLKIKAPLGYKVLHGWNLFVTHVSFGWLKGVEVVPPRWLPKVLANQRRTRNLRRRCAVKARASLAQLTAARGHPHSWKRKGIVSKISTKLANRGKGGRWKPRPPEAPPPSTARSAAPAVSPSPPPSLASSTRNRRLFGAAPSRKKSTVSSN